MLLRTALLPLTLVSLLAAAAPAAAGEMKIHHYGVLVEGEAEYTSHAETPGGATGTSTSDRDARFTWATEMTDLAFYDTTPTSAVAAATVVHVEHASHRYHLANVEPVDGECTGESADAEIQSATIKGLSIPTADGGRHLAVDLLDGVELGLPNCTGDGHPTSFDLDENVDAATGPFETTFEMPREAIGNGKIIQLLERRVTGADCPDHDGDAFKSCVLSWKAEVTFTKKSTETVTYDDDGDDLFVPIAPDGPPAPAPAPAPAPPAPPAPGGRGPVPGDDLFVPQTAQAKLSRTGATVPVSCPTGCTGEAVVTGVTGRARSAARPRPLARARFTVAPGGRTTVRLRFNARARRAIAKAKGVKLVLTAKPRGSAATVRETLTLRRR
jgi:hypothetical protein